jgi:hypothetical protein
MTTTFLPTGSEPPPLDHILESAVVLNWGELVRGARPGLIQLEYHIGEQPLIDDLRIWSSTARGFWSLVCHCSVNPDLSCTLNFKNGYQTGDFGKLLKAIMRHQGEFAHKRAVNTNYLVRVGPPSVDVVAIAKSSVEAIAGSQP